jgi:hypothetical protein
MVAEAEAVAVTAVAAVAAAAVLMVPALPVAQEGPAEIPE